MSCWDSFLSFHLDFGAGANMDKLWYLKFEPPPNSWIGRSWGATCHTKPTSLRCLFGTTQVQKFGRLRRFRDQHDFFLKKDWTRMSTPQRYPTWIMKSCLYEILGLYVYSPHKWIHIPPLFLSTGAFQSWILNHFKTIPGSSTSNSCPKGWFWANLHITAHFSRREAFFAQLLTLIQLALQAQAFTGFCWLSIPCLPAIIAIKLFWTVLSACPWLPFLACLLFTILKATKLVSTIN